jgi:surface protein
MLPSLAALNVTPTGVDKRSREDDGKSIADWIRTKIQRPDEDIPPPSIDTIPNSLLFEILENTKGMSCKQVLGLCRLNTAFLNICNTSVEWWRLQCELHRGWLTELRLSEYNRMTESMFSFTSTDAQEWKAFWEWGCKNMLTNEKLRAAVETRMPNNTATFYVDSVYGDMRQWDVSKVTDMNAMFYKASAFNADIGGWDVSNVTNMNAMFYKASAFNADIGGWDVSNVTDMDMMFKGATRFNADIGGWDVSKVTDMEEMFESSTAFNANIGGWDVSNVISMNSMFYEAAAFNADIGGWDVSNVMDMRWMFLEAEAFNQDLSLWDLSNVKNILYVFRSTPMENDFAFHPTRPPYSAEVVAARARRQQAARKKGERKRAEAGAV